MSNENDGRFHPLVDCLGRWRQTMAASMLAAHGAIQLLKDKRKCSYDVDLALEDAMDLLGESYVRIYCLANDCDPSIVVDMWENRVLVQPETAASEAAVSGVSHE